MSIADERVQYEVALRLLFEGIETVMGGGVGSVPELRLSLINYVKAKLDELIPTGEGISFTLSESPNITDPLDLLINAHLDECTKDVILSAPLSILKPIAAEVTAVPLTDSKTGYVELPASFLRLSSFKMAEWKRDATVITPHDARYKLQSTPLRGGLSKPIAVLTWRNITDSLKRVLDYYSVVNSHTVEKLLYIPETTAENLIDVTRNPNLLDALAWMCAGKIMQITGMVNEAKLAQERVLQSYLNQ